MRAGPSPRKPTSAQWRRGGGIAWLAALTMTVLALSPLLAMFHQISARHAVCEHGELVESDHTGSAPLGGASSGVEKTLTDAERAAATDVRPDSEAARHGHNHCSVGTLAKNSVVLLPSTQVVTVLTELVAPWAHHCELSYVRTALLAAPKTSPPRVAG